MTTPLLSPLEFRRVFDEYASSVFRLETLQAYAEPDEAAALAAFAAGGPLPPDPGKQEWLAAVRAAVAGGRTVQRVHVVLEPLSDYLRYELSWSYGPNAAAGEQIRIVAVPPGGPWPAGVPHRDFWLFDAERLYLQHYDDRGRWVGVEKDTDSAQVATARRWREAAWHRGVPWADYVRERPELVGELRRVS